MRYKQVFESDIDNLNNNGLLRHLRRVDSVTGTHAVIDGRRLTLFCTNDYLGLSGHLDVLRAAKEAIDEFGFGSGSAPLIAGRTSYQARLEERIASFKGAQAALVFGSGYLANVGLIPALAREGDLILSDALNHASIIDGCRLSRADVKIYAHHDMSSLESHLRASGKYKRTWIVTEGVFGMDGVVAPMPDILRLAEEHGASIILDDAHATGTLGKTGRGTLEHFGLQSSGVVQMGTLGKALGSYGAFVAADGDIIDWLLNSARSFMFSTALPPATCASALAALEIIGHEPERLERLRANHQRLRGLLAESGMRVIGEDTPIVPVVVGNAEDATSISAALMEAGFYAPAIRPPTVPEDQSRIRFTVSALHTYDEIDTLSDALKTVVIK